MPAGTGLNPLRALALASIAGVGLYAIGKEAVAHRKAIRGGEPPTHVPAGFTSSVADDIVAFVAGTTAVGVLLTQLPALYDSAKAMLK